VKPLNNLNLPSLQKKQSSSKSDIIAIYLLASLIGTYLDLYFVGKGLYSFPRRLFPDIFTINIGFTLIVLPLFTFILLFIMNIITSLKRWGLVFTICLMIASIEKLSESYGFFVHSEDWRHWYSFVGYFVFLFVMWRFFQWIKK
jgi:hypothetical protein